MQKITVRDFRAKMGQHFKAGRPVAIGDHYKTAALVIPFPAPHYYRTKKKEIRAARAAALAAFKELKTEASE